MFSSFNPRFGILAEITMFPESDCKCFITLYSEAFEPRASLKDTSSHHNGGGGGAHNGIMNAAASTTVNQNNDEAAAAAFAISGSGNGAQGSVHFSVN